MPAHTGRAEADATQRSCMAERFTRRHVSGIIWPPGSPYRPTTALQAGCAQQTESRASKLASKTELAQQERGRGMRWKRRRNQFPSVADDRCTDAWRARRPAPIHGLPVWVALATASMIELIVFPDDGSFTRHGGSYHQNDRAREHRAGRPS